MGPLEEQYLQEFRKVVILETSFVDGYAALDADRITIRYGIGPNHIHESPAGYQVIVEADDGGEVVSFSHEHPALAWVEGAGCAWVPPENAGPVEIFDFIQPRARTVRILDVDDEITCEGQTYVGSRAELLLVDLQPCLDTFCTSQAAAGDPACP